MGLSEQKSRTIYAPDPRNLGWSQDKNRFGFKMLEKMGWSEGKGLGAKEDGLKEHVKIKLKSNNHGIGADKKTIRNWLANADGYSELLDRLNTETPADEPKEVEQPKNTEQVLDAASKQLGRMSHRAKFRRMKQMATRDAKGLQEIFGVRGTDVNTNLPTPQSAGSGEEGDSSLRLTTTTVNTGICVSDYFANKMANNPELAAVYSAQEPSPIESDSTKAKSSKKRKSPVSEDIDLEEKHRQKSKKSEKEKKDKKSKKDKSDRKNKISKDKKQYKKNGHSKSKTRDKTSNSKDN
ncbi:hypothetical protein H4R24_003598 [Coemansia sp. RSA 988]|nr:hypothetical protein H4R24_003598 [Coemansia sp. RSA 988]